MSRVWSDPWQSCMRRRAVQRHLEDVVSPWDRDLAPRAHTGDGVAQFPAAAVIGCDLTRARHDIAAGTAVLACGRSIQRRQFVTRKRLIRRGFQVIKTRLYVFTLLVVSSVVTRSCPARRPCRFCKHRAEALNTQQPLPPHSLCVIYIARDACLALLDFLGARLSSHSSAWGSSGRLSAGGISAAQRQRRDTLRGAHNGTHGKYNPNG